VPRRIDRGEWIYDRTAQEWVFHEDMGRNPRYLAGPQSCDCRDRDGHWRERTSGDDRDWRDDRRDDWRDEPNGRRDDWRGNRDWRDDRVWRGERD
jgi:hypothetical protein